MAELKGDINIKRNIEKCFELFDFSEENVKRIDDTILFHTVENKTPETVGTTYLQGRDVQGDILETTLKITEYVEEESCKKIGAHFNVNDIYEVNYYYKLDKVDENNTTFTYYIKSQPTKFLMKVVHKLSRMDKKSNIDSFLQHIKTLIESN